MKKFPYLSIACILIITLFTCISFQNAEQPMIKLNNDDYAAEWKKIEAFERKGLPKSALEAVNKLYERAKLDDNAAQIVKTLMHRGKYTSQLEEDGLVKAIGAMTEEVKTAEFPTQAVLQSVLGEMYKKYLESNYWKFRDRTETINFKTDDIRTWTVGQLIEESSKLYMASVEHPKLPQVAIKDFAAITTGNKNVDNLRTNLYDFLVHRAIDYFMNDQSYLTEPAYKFTIQEDVAFASASNFVNRDITTKDTESFKYKTLILFQDLLKSHLDDKAKDDLVNADLKRLKFAYDNAARDKRDSLYLAALGRLQREYDQFPVVTEVMHKIAQLHYNKGQQYRPNPDSLNRWKLKEAYEICEAAINKFPESFGTTNCRNLQAQILRKNLDIRTEQVNLPGKPILALVEYKNVDSVFLKVAEFTDDHSEIYKKRNSREQLDFLNSLDPIYSWSETLPNDGDYHRHSVEIPMDTLTIGKYVVIASDDPNFSADGHAVAHLFTHVSNIGYWHRKDEHNQTEFVVTNRETGAPLENVIAEFYVNKYNRKERKNEYFKAGNAVSNDRGFIFPRIGQNQYYETKFIYGDDVLQIGDRFSSYSYYNRPKKYETTHFFLDRAIYRPGQTVYFKGIVIAHDETNMPSILPNQEVTITFKDANYQEVKKVQLTTNEYGTVNGSFIAPSAGLLGQMSLESSVGNTRQFFRVEEYKRPKFEVKFPPLENSYTLGDRVTLKGQAKAYAGSNIDGAKVTYRVVRETRFPHIPWWYWRGGYNPYKSADLEVTNGTTTTDAKGEFQVEFMALADRTIPKDKKPEFHYKVYATVTDITGETQSDETSITVGYVALQVDLDVPDKVDRDTLRTFGIDTKSLNGEFQPAKGRVIVHSLRSPKKTFIKRFWEKPDMHIMRRGQFYNNFPTHAYQDEDELQKWKQKEQVFKGTFNTANSKKIDIGMIKYKWQPGNYRITIKTKDRYGNELEVKEYFTLYDAKDKLVPINVPGWHVMERNQYKPGDVAKLLIGTAEEEINVLFEIERNKAIVSSQWIDVKKFDDVDFDIIEKDRGNIHLHFSFVKNNRSYHDKETLVVPWSNKELNIEYGTFRNKLKPGEDEEWQIKIKGNKKEKIAAEMVATMYDASLDEFAANNWFLSVFPKSGYAQRSWQPKSFSGVGSRVMAFKWQPEAKGIARSYHRLNWFNWGFYEGYAGGMVRSRSLRGNRSNEEEGLEMVAAEISASPPAAPMAKASAADFKEADGIDNYDATTPPSGGGGEDDGKTDFGDVQIRKNLNETVFFFPNLMTDKDGNLVLKFKMNEALTRWKFLGLAHTQDLKIGKTQKEVVTQKELMVLPNVPRFMREGDDIVFSAKVSNLTQEDMNGTARLELYDAISMRPVDVAFAHAEQEQDFTALAEQSVPLAWKLKVPFGKVQMLTYRIVAKSGAYSDGEEDALPVLTNRMLVTETLPLPVRGGETEEFMFASLKGADASSSLQHQQFSVEFTSNPAWYAVQALPYLMEYPYDCIEQVFNRYYANSLATSVANSHPKIKAVFEDWKNSDAMLSNLSKNQELKTALLEETPWVLQAQSEAEQKKNIGLLFDLNKMAYEQDQALAKIKERQAGNGGFAWFAGGRESWHITQYIAESMGHLEKLGVNTGEDETTANMLRNAVAFIDAKFLDHYEELERRVADGKAKWEDDHLNNIVIHYLYARSFFLQQQLQPDTQKAMDYYIGQAEKYWLDKGLYQEGMIALALQRMNKMIVPTEIVESLKERSLNDEEQGMYWKYNRGYYWYQLPIETHALMIEVFDEVAKDAQAVDDLKVWLLKNKQTTHWKTTKATAAAVYALLMNGDNWLLDSEPIRIVLGEDTASDPEIESYTAKIKDAQNTAEAGTGYFKVNWNGAEVDAANMSNIKIENPNKVVSWGAAYWQYFEDLDKIKTFEETPLTLNKQLFKIENSSRGEKLKPIEAGATLEPGDQIKVRIELRVDRDMEYVHLKDMRASGFEPINVLSQYKYQGGLGYYESTRDVSTNFFFSYLPKGTYVFEYPLQATIQGDFSNGISTIQSMYAPEFSSHSEGIRVKVQ